MPMNALLIGSDHLLALAAIFHHEFLAVAGSAGCGNIGVMYARPGIARGQQFMRAAVAINASGGVSVACLDGFAVEAAIVGCLLIGVAASAGDLPGGVLMCGAFNVGMTIHAGEHGAVDGIFELVRIHVEANRLAVDIMSQAGVTMAGQTFVSGRFWRSFGSAWSSRSG